MTALCFVVAGIVGTMDFYREEGSSTDRSPAREAKEAVARDIAGILGTMDYDLGVQEDVAQDFPFENMPISEDYDLGVQEDVAQDITFENMPISDIGFLDIRTARNKMTDVQYDEYCRRIEGKKVQWAGWVENVDTTMFGAYMVWIDMDPPEHVMSSQDVYFEVSKDTAMALNKDRKVMFSGVIKSAGSLLGSCHVTLEPAKVALVR